VTYILVVVANCWAPTVRLRSSFGGTGCFTCCLLRFPSPVGPPLMIALLGPSSVAPVTADILSSPPGCVSNVASLGPCATGVSAAAGMVAGCGVVGDAGTIGFKSVTEGRVGGLDVKVGWLTGGKAIGGVIDCSDTSFVSPELGVSLARGSAEVTSSGLVSDGAKSRESCSGELRGKSEAPEVEGGLKSWEA
jgi:hypothetical protein